MKESNFEGGPTPEKKESGIFRIKLSELRDKVKEEFDEYSKRYDRAVEAHKDIPNTGVIFSPNREIVLDADREISLGLQVSPSEINDFMTNDNKCLEILTKHLHIGGFDDESGDRVWAEARLEGDEIVIHEIKE